MDAALDAALRRFHDRNPLSQEIFEHTQNYLPDGSARTLLYTAPFPASLQRGEGYKVYDEDGRVYCDLVGELTASLYGHSHPRLREVSCSSLYSTGHSAGGTKHEHRYASMLCQRFNLDRLQFTNSSLEANLQCLFVARKFTGRRKLVAFRGGYHGGVLASTTGMAPNNIDRDDWIMAQYNNTDSVREAFERNEDIAAVIVEGLQSSSGSVSATVDFLRVIRNLSEKAGAVFILDEVNTSRLAHGGLKSTLPVLPDMITLGNHLGAGMPLGAFGGREDMMNVYDPRIPCALAHHGSFQIHIPTLNTGYIGLSEVYTGAVVSQLNFRGDDLRRRLNDLFQRTRLCVIGQGSMMCVHATLKGLQPSQITCKDDILSGEDVRLQRLFWLEMLLAGYWIKSSGSIVLNLQTPDEAIDSFVAVVSRFCSTHWELIRLPDLTST